MEKPSKSTKPIRDFPPSWEPQDQEERELDEMFRDGTIAKAVERYMLKGPVPLKRGTSVRPTKVPVTIRIDKLTLLVLKDRAHDEGLRYQSLINSVLLKYITGKLVERKK
jgi:uncharacterized protein (DUF4415 family)